MAVKSRVRKGFQRLIKSRKGTAEIVGSIMFLLILLFFFTNVYLWHDVATRGMNDVLAEKMNSPVSIEWDNGRRCPVVTNNGGVNVALSRLWIIDINPISGEPRHNYADLEKDQELWVAAGDTIKLTLNGITQPTNGDPYDVSGTIVSYGPTSGVTVTFKILTTLGNTAACQYIRQ